MQFNEFEKINYQNGRLIVRNNIDTNRRGYNYNNSSNYIPQKFSKFKRLSFGKKFKRRFFKKRGRICIVSIKQTGNNMFLMVCSLKTNNMLFCTTLGWTDVENNRLKGSKKYTPHGAERAGENLGYFIYRRRIQYFILVIKSKPTPLLTAAIKGISKYKRKIVSVKSLVPISHNGLRKKKLRREKKKKDLKTYNKLKGKKTKVRKVIARKLGKFVGKKNLFSFGSRGKK